MSNTYPQEQQIHSLSLIANPAYGEEFSQPNAFSNLQAYANQVTTAILEQDQGANGGNYLGSTADNNAWELLWGPVVFSNDQGANTVVADNTMTLFYNPSQNLFVIAIAGTNGVSSFGWLSEDFDVSTTVPWNTVVPNTQAPSNAVIATGSNTGLLKLLAIQDANSKNQTLVQFLASYLSSLGANTQTIAVAGHSLGGALTPVMALYLFETASSWNTNGSVNAITAYPTAGPTPGDSNFASYYQTVVSDNTQPNPISFSFTAKYNTIDVVPQAWELDTLVTVPFLYEPNSYNEIYTAPPTIPDVIVASLTVGGIASSYNTSQYAFNNYTHIQPRIPLTGTFATAYSIDEDMTSEIVGIGYIFYWNSTLYGSQLYTPTDYVSYLQNFAFFAMEMVYQHTTEYSSANLLNIEDFALEYQTVQSGISGPSTDITIPKHSKVARNLVAKFTGIRLDKLPKNQTIEKHMRHEL